MHYEIYIDVVFFTNLLIDYILIRFIGILFRCGRSRKRALLGAAALGDIGKHFPDTDPAYKGISSILLLEHVTKLLREHHYEIGNIDATIIAQKPKMAPHIPQMRANMAKAMGINESQLNIKATTEEKLGFTGREEGIASQAICLLNERKES